MLTDDNSKKDPSYTIFNLLKIVKTYFMAVLVGILISIFIVKVIRPVIVDGNSMYPTFKDGQLLFASSVPPYDELKYGDIIVFRENHVSIIKRIIGLSGDEIQIKEGNLYVNNKIISNYPYIEDAGILSDMQKIGENEVFCIGDNINNSLDSRIIGPIQYDQILSVIKR